MAYMGLRLGRRADGVRAGAFRYTVRVLPKNAPPATECTLGAVTVAG
jgi:hypothetical protein